MIQPNFSTSDAMSNPAAQPVLMQSLQSYLPADASGFDHAHGSDRDASRALRASRDTALELAYGCVDWFIYVTDSVAIGPVACLGGSE